MRVVRATDCRRMPWKNGGGETVEIATFPEGAGLDDFVWRLSAARVAQNGPFSLFADIDRTLAVLSGKGLELRVGEATTRLGPGDTPVSFPGDQPTAGCLIGGPVEDLNIMTRRGAARHRMRRVPVEGRAQLAAEGTAVLLFCAEGMVRVGDTVLGPRDTAILNGHESVDANGQGVLHVIEVEVNRPSMQPSPC